MASTLMGAVITGSQANPVLDATITTTAFGASHISHKKDGWPAAVTTAISALWAAVLNDDGGLQPSEIQIYMPCCDPAGHPPYAGPGECVDLKFVPGSPIAGLRIGQLAAVPADIAAARDALKAAIAAAL